MTLPGAAFDRPRWAHRLAVALRFVDHFSGAVVRTPLAVWTTLPTPPPGARWLRAPTVDPADPPGSSLWRARRVAADDTYRLFVSDGEVPNGTFAVQVDDPTGRYRSLEPISVVLPRPRTPPPPPALRADFLLDVPLWPTSRAPVTPGDTAVVGRLVRVVGPDRVPVPGFRVRLFEPPGPPPATPYARSDERGEFTVRFPALRRDAGPPPVVAVAVDVEVRDAADAVVAAVPASLSLPLGQVTAVEITVP